MPTIFRKDGFRFYFYSDEGNEPPHVHVECNGAVAKFWLHDFSLAYNRGMTGTELSKASRLTKEHGDLIKGKWDEFFCA